MITGSFFDIYYKFIFDSKKNKMKNQTSQTGKGNSHPLIIIQGTRIQEEKLVMKIFNPTFLFYSVTTSITNTKISRVFCVKRRKGL
jgi:hypothetical protein